MNSESRDLAIGVFDSGMGGISVLASLITSMPYEKFIYYGDSLHAPYGIKSVEEVINLSISVCDLLISKGVKAIVVACNTATSAAIKVLREKYNIPIIGMEPAIKPAIEVARDKKVLVMATPITLKEKKFYELTKRLAIEDKIIKLPAPELVEIVESGNIEGTIPEAQIKEYFSNLNLEEIGSVVLGCTHFVFLSEVIKNFLGPHIYLIDGNMGTAKHLKNILLSKSLLRTTSSKNGNIEIFNSSDDEMIMGLSRFLLDYSLGKKVRL